MMAMLPMPALSIPLPVVRPPLLPFVATRCPVLQHVVPPHVCEVGFSVLFCAARSCPSVRRLCTSHPTAGAIHADLCLPNGPHSTAGVTCDSGKMLEGVMLTSSNDDCANHGRCHIRTRTGRIHGTSAHWDWAHCCHVCIQTGPALATSGTGAHHCHICAGTGACPCHICAGTGAYRCEDRGIRLLLCGGDEAGRQQRRTSAS